jgi:hypothetical protein
VYAGPTAVPGNYKVVMTAGGKTVSENFEIKMDPRVNDVTIADMQEKFNLSIQIRDEVSKANEAVIKIRAIKEKINEEAKAKNTTVSKANQALMMELSSIEENLYQVRNQSSQDPLNFPIKLNNKLASLMRVVESGDYKPTAGSYKVFEELKAELALEINHLDKVLSQKTIKKYL